MLAAENRELREMMFRLEAAYGGRIAALEAEIDRLRLEMAERDRRLVKYENPHARPRLVSCTMESAPPSGR